jgi:hypothetical protein
MQPPAVFGDNSTQNYTGQKIVIGNEGTPSATQFRKQETGLYRSASVLVDMRAALCLALG